MTIVVDASMTIAWLFEGDINDKAFDRVLAEDAFALATRNCQFSVECDEEKTLQRQLR